MRCLSTLNYLRQTGSSLDHKQIKESPMKLTRREKEACNRFVAVVQSYVGNDKVENCVELVEKPAEDL